MIEFLLGCTLGALLMFCYYQYRRWQEFYSKDISAAQKSNNVTQLENMMNYDGSIRGQKEFEN